MRIVYIVPGPAGPFFEKNSLREQALVAELRWCGHEVLLIPLLFPLTPDKDTSPSAETVPLFGGAVRVYSRHCFPFLADHAPEWIWRHIDTQAMRRRVSRHVLGVPSRFCRFIKDALDGRNGALTSEMHHLCRWLQKQRQPDIVMLSTPFFLGTAAMLKRTLRVPVVCCMNAELEDLSRLQGPEGIILLTKLRSLIGDADGFIPVSQFHSDRIQSRLGVPSACSRPVHPGIETENFTVASRPASPVIGIVVGGRPETAEISPHLAVSLLRHDTRTAPIPIKVAVNFRLLGQDHEMRSLSAAGGKVETLPRTPEEVSRFFGGLSLAIFIHPTLQPAFDYLVLEALACGVPVFLQDNGANREIQSLSDAVMLYRDIAGLVNAVGKFLDAPAAEQDALRQKARRSVEHCFSMPRMAQETAEVLQMIINRHAPQSEPWAIRQPATVS